MLPQCNCHSNYLDPIEVWNMFYHITLVNPFVSVGYSPYHHVLSQRIQNNVQLDHFACM